MAKVATLFAVLAFTTLTLATFALWLRVAPGANDWTMRIPIAIGPLRPFVEVSVFHLLDAVTDPAWARWLDGRRIATPLGELELRWQDGTLAARCAPCLLHIDALGDTPVTLVSATLSLQRDGARRYVGEIESLGVRVRWNAGATRTSLALSAELAETPIASLYAALGDAVPETRRARIEGTIAAHIKLDLPAGRWSIEPVVEGFGVSGLGTEALRHVQLPAHCQAPGRVSPWLERAVVAAEDQRFFEHQGYDIAEMQQAIAGNQQREGKSRGASTIDQQLAKLLHTGDAQSLSRKARELLYAVEMDRALGKARVLGLYLSLAPWGEGVCGAESAARHYFAKEAAALDPLEAAWLAVRLRLPDAPRAAVTPERVAQVLRAMRGLSPSQRTRWIGQAVASD